jgi:hypothetical protein
MKICCPLFAVFFFFVGEVSAQKEIIQSTVDTLSLDYRIGLHNATMLSGFDNSTTEIQSNFYLDHTWSIATVRFYPRTIGTSKGAIKLDSVSDVQMRVLLKGNDIEFNSKEGIKVISGGLIRSFTIRKNDLLIKNYISTQEYTDNSDIVKSGFFEILANGKLKLLEYSKLKIHQSDNKPAFNLGNQYVMTDTEKLLFIAKDSKEVIKFNIGKKDLYELMADKKPEIEKFVKDNKLSLKNRTDLTKIFQYYNAL